MNGKHQAKSKTEQQTAQIEEARVQEALVAYARQQEAVAELGQQALRGNDLQGFMEQVVQRVAETLGAQLCGILELRSDQEALWLRAGVGWSEGEVGTAVVQSGASSQAGYTLLQDEPVLAHDLPGEIRFSVSPLLAEHAVVSSMTTVIDGVTRPYGVLGVHSRQSRLFSQDEARFLQSIANILGAAIQRKQAETAMQVANSSLEERVEKRTALLKQQIKQRKQAEQSLQQESGNLRLLQEIAATANKAASIEEAFRVTLDLICNSTGWPLAHLYIRASDALSDGRDDEMVSSGIWRCQDDGEQFALCRSLTSDTRIAYDTGWLGQVFRTGKPAWILDVTQEASARHQQLQHIGMVAGLAFPVLVGDEVAAIMEFFAPQAQAPEPELLEVMANIGAQLGRVVERERAYRQIKQSLEQLQLSQATLAQKVARQQEMEQALQRSQVLLATAQRVANMGSWEWDLKTGELTWSEGLYRIYGLSPDSFEPTYENFVKLILPEDREEALKIRERNFQEQKESYEFHLRIQRPDGKLRYIHNRNLVIYDDAGDPLRVFGTSQDETELRLAEAQIARQTRQLIALNAMGQAVASKLELTATVSQVLAKVHDLFQADGIFIALWHPERQLLEVTAASNDTFGLPVSSELPPDVNILEEALSANKIVLVQGKAEVAQRASQQSVPLLDDSIGAVMAAPMHLQDQIIGLVLAVHQQEDGFSANDVSVLETAVAWAAIAIGNARLYEAVQHREARLRELAEQIVNVQEAERQRVSRELHDEAGQALTALRLSLEYIASELKNSPLQVQLNQALDLSQQTMQRIRMLAYDLRPPEIDTIGLDAALRDFCLNFTRHTQLALKYTSDDLPPGLPDVVQLSFYRYLQEALTNIARHAQASQVEVKLSRTNRGIFLSVADNGKGFNVAQAAAGDGLGLLGMKERFAQLGGSLQIQSQENEGAILVAGIPQTYFSKTPIFRENLDNN